MGKNLIQQRRGKGSIFTSRSFAAPGAAFVADRRNHYTVIDLIHSNMHTAPLAHVKYDDETTGLILAAEGLFVGTTHPMSVKTDEKIIIKSGSILALKDIPEGTPVFNIEAKPGDGGKFVRSSGGVAKIVMRSDDTVTIKLPSKKNKNFHPNCRATIGVVAGGGRVEKPLLKAGKNFHRHKARNKYYPIVSGSAMNAVAHPFGNKRSLRKSKAKPTSRNAPPGRKVGSIAASRTGRKR
jgi:large subunit ribosomal protein L2